MAAKSPTELAQELDLDARTTAKTYILVRRRDVPLIVAAIYAAEAVHKGEDGEDEARVYRRERRGRG